MISVLAKLLYKCIGWKVEGHFPHEIKKKVLIVAPHTSTQDFYVGILVKFWYDIKCHFYAKKELFNGLQGWALRSIGGIAIDREKNSNLVGQAIADFNQREEHCILITPEGTRKKVEKFKTGFYYIADLAKVPIIPIQFDFKQKVIRILSPFYTTGDAEKDIQYIENLFRGIVGKNPAQSFS